MNPGGQVGKEVACKARGHKSCQQMALAIFALHVANSK